jgi:hypothetical protein
MGSRVCIPNACRIGSQKAKSSPITPKQQQQTINITTIVMIQGLVFFGVAAGGGSGVPAASLMD